MTRQRAVAVLAAVVALLLALDALVYSMYRRDVAAVEATLDDRLRALGTTAARWLAERGDAAATGALLATLVDANRLEDAYVVDAGLAVVAGARTAAGPLNLLRADDERLTAAFDGSASIGDGYAVDGPGSAATRTAVEAAYFPVRVGATVLALEAGAEFHAPAAQLRATLVASFALTAVIAVVFGAGAVLALRALERARVAYGRAERLAAVGQMAAMVAHEVRNPLGILRGSVELAREHAGDALPPREHERLADMLAEIDRIARLTDEFLDLARDVPLDLGDVDVGELLAAIGAELRVVAPEAAIAVDVPAPVVVRGDAAQVRQAILNLALNAVQVGGPAVAVRLGVAVAHGRARIAVSDDGPGVAAELVDTLFEPFVSGRAGGSGLGLTIARRVAERHGGTLALEPAGAHGATFAMYLPV